MATNPQLSYHELGFRCGVEIHQQLEGQKLFCRCPTTIRKDPPDISVQRKLRAAAGEGGAVDIAAQYEQTRGKQFIYHGYRDTTCLVELDEEPPGPINEKALHAALQVASLLHCTIVDEIQVMRKTVIDGSNTSGFQRTALVGRDGELLMDGKKVSIPTVCLEEEACQVIERGAGRDAYNLSRLGIPLIEIATGPDLHTPEECRKACLQLGMILRSVDGLKRGIGSIRQDVNVSIKGGARTEIKGFQDVQSIHAIIDYEISRQLAILKKNKPIAAEVRKAEPDGTTSFLRPMPGAARMYPETDVLPVQGSLQNIAGIELLDDKAKKLEGIGIAKDLADAAAKAGKADAILLWAKQFPTIKPAFIAESVVSIPITIRRKENITANPSNEEYAAIFSELSSGHIVKEAVHDIIISLGKTGRLDFARFKLLSDDDVEREVAALASENAKVPQNAMIGLAMNKLRGRADPAKVIAAVKRMMA